MSHLKIVETTASQSSVSDRLNPGSDYAVVRGCTCEPEANRRGLGHAILTGLFVREPGCPLHGFSWKADAA